MALSLDDVLSTIISGQQKSQAIADQLVNAYGAQSGAISQAVTDTGVAGRAKATQLEQEQQGLLRAQTNTREAATALGTNMDSPSQIVTLLGNDMRNSYAELKRQQARVNKLNEGATLSNPLGLLTNIVIGDEERAKLEADQANFDLAAKTLQSLNQATQQTAATQKAIAETKTQASVDASLEELAANTRLAQAELRSKLAGVNVQMLGALDALNNRQTQTAIQMYNLGVQEDQRQFMRAQREADRALREESKKEDELSLAAYNAALDLQGRSPVDMAAFKTAIKLDREGTAELLRLGFQRTSGSGVVRYGTTPLMAISSIQSNRLNLPEGQRQVAAQMDSWMAASTKAEALADVGVAKNAVEATQMLANKKELPRIQNEYLSRKAKANLSLIDPKDETNIYAPPPIDILKNKPYLLENKFLASELAPSVEAGGNIKFNPSQLIEQALAGVTEGRYTTSDIAEGISWVANQFILTNNSTKNYLGFGLPPMSDFMNMPLSAKAGPYASTITATINVADPVQVTAYFQRVMAAAPKKLPLLDLAERSLRNTPLGGIAQTLGQGINTALERNKIENLLEPGQRLRQ